jgi:hypothetical protein
MVARILTGRWLLAAAAALAGWSLPLSAVAQFGSSSGGLTPRRAAMTAQTTSAASGSIGPPGSNSTSPPSRAVVETSENYFQRRRSPVPPDSQFVDQRGQARTFQERSGNTARSAPGILPNDAGQVWRQYDISPYTLRVKNKAKPEQAIIDWILRETGTDVWFSSPVGLLNADSRTLRCYHTPQMQEVVRGVVDRFVSGDAESQVLGIRVMTVASPSWRARALPLLRAVDVKSPGVEAWLLSPENAAVLVADLKRRGDYRELNAPNLQIHSGQTEVIAKTHPRAYLRTVRATNVFPFYEIVPGQLDEGFALQVSPLMSLDGKACDVVIKCNIDQVEKFVPIQLDVPIGGSSQRVQIQVPQLVSWRLHERIRWPADQVLLLSCGVVANPTGEAAPAALSMLPLVGSPSRADALLMIEHKGRASQNPVEFVPTLLPTASQPAAPQPAVPPAVIPPTSYIDTRGRY